MMTIAEELNEAKAAIAMMEGELTQFKATGTLGPWMQAKYDAHVAKRTAELKAKESALRAEVEALRDGIEAIHDGTHPMCLVHRRTTMRLQEALANAEHRLAEANKKLANPAYKMAI